MDFKLLAQTILFGLSCLFSIIAIICQGVIFKSNPHRCILYADAHLMGDSHYVIEVADATACEFFQYTMIFFGMLSSFFLCIYYGYVLRGTIKDLGNGSMAPLVTLIIAAIAALCTFLVFVAALVFTVGLKHFCDVIKEKIVKADVSCWDYQSSFEGIDNYIDYLRAAQVTVWVTFFLWLVQLIFTAIPVIQMWRDHRGASGTHKAARTPATDY